MSPWDRNHNGRAKRRRAEGGAGEQHGDHSEQEPPNPTPHLWFRDARFARSSTTGRGTPLLNHREGRSLLNHRVRALAPEPRGIGTVSFAAYGPWSRLIARRAHCSTSGGCG